MSTSSVPHPPTRLLTSFSVLTLDIFGTLIDWESGILRDLEPIIARLPQSHPLVASNDPQATRLAVGQAFVKAEGVLMREKPGLKYSALLAETYIQFSKELEIAFESDEALEEDAEAFGGSVSSWPAFADTVDAMNRLHKHFKLVPLSNVDRESFSGTCKGPLRGIDPGFDAIYTAEDIGSYKPDLQNFDYLFENLKKDFGIEKDQILHTAQSLTHDHVPAKQLGLTSAWIARGPGGKTGMGGDPDELIRSGKVDFSWRFGSLGEMADAVEKEVKDVLDGNVPLK
ncbi:hypothetical protein G7046_g326 [Stylonectria norvegica]|nr:hypothetical protein G7046_g326 [Stylonectria norvegica]